MLDKLAELETRFEDVNAALADPAVTSDMAQMTALSKEFKELQTIVGCGRRFREVEERLASTRQLLHEETDEDFLAMAREELQDLEARHAELDAELRNLLTPKDPEDSLNVMLEVRAGTGGDEASLFAGDLYRMYKRFCELKGWQMDITDVHEGTAGGFKEIVLNIRGEDVYGTLKFEGGVHRVQRVPATETQGRIHTSTATVVVMPEPEEFDVELNDRDLRIDRFCSSGNGGQSVNTTYSAVRLTHEPTGLVVSMQNERSQLKNLELAKKILKARLYEQELAKRKAEESAMRQSMVSTGDRSAKIRTYNFPQSRLTDHRIGLTVHNLGAVLDGQLDDILEALRIAENAQKLAAGETGSVGK